MEEPQSIRWRVEQDSVLPVEPSGPEQSLAEWVSVNTG